MIVKLKYVLFSLYYNSTCQDRCHRIGQTKEVTVYKLVVKDTVDEDIYDMGERKEKLSKALLRDDMKDSKEDEVI